MIEVKSELNVYFDVDDTLVMWDEPKKNGKGKYGFVMNDEVVYLYPHEANISFLVNLKSRGYFVTVWSGNGHAWARHVIEGLGLEASVDVVMSKPIKVVDNEHTDKWFPKPFTLSFEKP